ncbi:predicted protein [Nematostella vectensis]|uniref:Uncharacterized protein n=1 Tax=Nematostella vectensis TaxID=45351 RepID=A7S2X9_NEMVE|nr:predicted protein [Nematostella vectensis]|eukprot:XP_001634031.1 predicted protein [Nematostella vectensis]
MHSKVAVFLCVLVAVALFCESEALNGVGCKRGNRKCHKGKRSINPLKRQTRFRSRSTSNKRASLGSDPDKTDQEISYGEVHNEIQAALAEVKTADKCEDGQQADNDDKQYEESKRSNPKRRHGRFYFCLGCFVVLHTVRQRLAKVGREQKEDGDNNLRGRGWFRRQAMQWGHKGWAKRQAQLNEGWKSVNDDKGWAKPQAQLYEGWKSVDDDKGWAKPQAQIYEGWKSVNDDKGWAKPQAQIYEGWKSVNDDKGWAKRQAQLNEGWKSVNDDKGWAKRQAQLNEGWKSANYDKGWAKRQAQLNEGWKSVNDDKGWAKPHAQLNEGWKSVNDDKGWAKPHAQLNEGWKSSSMNKFFLSVVLAVIVAMATLQVSAWGGAGCVYKLKKREVQDPLPDSLIEQSTDALKNGKWKAKKNRFMLGIFSPICLETKKDDSTNETNRFLGTHYRESDKMDKAVLKIRVSRANMSNVELR